MFSEAYLSEAAANMRINMPVNLGFGDVYYLASSRKKGIRPVEVVAAYGLIFSSALVSPFLKPCAVLVSCQNPPHWEKATFFNLFILNFFIFY